MRKTFPVSFKMPKFLALDLLDRFNITKPPIDIAWILKEYMLNIEEIDFPKDVDHISWMLDIDTKTIFINRNDADTRKAFTVAHELWHYIMHQKELELDDSYAIVYRKESSSKDEIEKQANEFAAHLLAPKFLIDKFKKELDIKQLAELFWVSQQMMEYRLSNEYT